MSKELQEKWQEVIEADVANTEGLTKDAVVAHMLENQEAWCVKNGGALNEASTAPNNATGSAIANWTPTLIKMAKRVGPNLIAFDAMGVQPLKGPDGQIFAMRSRYASQAGAEALHDEANSAFSGTGAQAGDTSGFATDAFGVGDPVAGTSFGQGMATTDAEKLGSATGNAWGEMGVSIEKTTVSAKSRGLKADYSHELRQDMMAIHDEDVDGILSDMLVTEIQAEMNREFLRTVNVAAKIGSQGNAVAGKLDINADTDGRWMLERWKGAFFRLELEANEIARQTRRGKGNFIICSANVASAFAAAQMIDVPTGVSANFDPDVTGATVIGTLNKRFKVIVDPYATTDYVTVGYKGSSALDAGIFFAPYTPLEMYRAAGEDTFQPRMAFKTRYGVVANPFEAKDAAGADRAGKGLAQDTNRYYRKQLVTNII